MANRNMLQNSNFEDTRGILYNWQTDQYVDPQTSGGVVGKNCIRFSAHPTGAPHHLSQSMDLAPGYQYAFSCQAAIFGQFAIYLAIATKKADGNWLWAFSPSFGVNNGWNRISHTFTVPANTASENVWVYVRGVNATGAGSSAYALVDDVQLVGNDGVGNGNVGEYARTTGWANVHTTPAGSVVGSIWPNALCRIAEIRTVGSDRWVRITRLEGPNGWVFAPNLGLENSGSQTRSMACIRSERTNVNMRRPGSTSTSAPGSYVARWSGPAAFCHEGVFSLAGILYYKVRWLHQNETGDAAYEHLYVAEEMCETMFVWPTIKENVLTLARSYCDAEAQRRAMNGASFGLTGDWCESWIEWMYRCAGLADSRLPNEKDTFLAMKWFIKNNNTAKFYFTSQASKTWLRNRHQDIEQHTQPDLTSEERSFVPQAGDFVYIRYSTEEKNISHVGLVAAGGSANFTTCDGNVKGNVTSTTNVASYKTRMISNNPMGADGKPKDEVVGFGRLII